MSRNEIRLKRQRLTARGSERFRNYGAVLQRHEQEVRLKKIMRVFTLFAVILILVMLIIIVVRIEKRTIKGQSNLFEKHQGYLKKFA
jgi:preprotein translocase subunit SecY